MLSTVLTPAPTPTTTPNASASGLVGHWKFDEATGSTACDSSGNGNTGMLMNGPLRAVGKVGGALYFDGIDDNVTIADSNSLDVSSSFTLSAWVNPTSPFTDFRSILVKNYKYYLYASAAGYCGSGSPLAGFDEQTTNAVCQPSPLPANTWTHLAATYTGSILTLYRNGVAVATSNIARTITPTTGTLQIGASQFGENFKGLIDEVRVHNRALNNSEIQAIFQQESAVRESGLVAHWKFDEGNGTTAPDSSGSGNAGVLTNGPQWMAGRIGKALYFDGIDDNITIADSNSLDLSSSFTLSAWVNPASTSTDFRSILVKNYRYYLYASAAGYCGNGSPLAGFDEQTSSSVCQLSPLTANTWTHLAATYTGSILTLYQNGVPVATSNVSKTLSSSTGTLQIGASQFGENFKGLIDEVRVHNRALSITELQAMFQQESGDLGPTSPPVATAPGTGSLFSFSLANSGDKSVIAGSSVGNSITASLVSASSQAISFSASGLPSGATASFSSGSCTPACSTVLTISTTGLTPAGTFPVTVTSTGGGVIRSTAFTLSVTLAVAGTLPSSSSGNIYYVAKSGSNSNTCAQAKNQATPKLTINAGIACLTSGDTLEIKTGTYTEVINTNTLMIPSGSSWSNATTIRRFGQDTVTINGGAEYEINLPQSSLGYIVFDGLVLDGINETQAGAGCVSIGGHHIRFVNVEIKNCAHNGVIGGGDNHEFINVTIHDNGRISGGPANAYYLTTNGAVVERNVIYNIKGIGIRFFNSDGTATVNNIARYNVIHNFSQYGTAAGSGIFIGSANNTAHNNLIYNGNGPGISVNYISPNNTKIYNNTVYNNSSYGIDISASAVATVVKNNIIYNNLVNVQNLGVGSVISNNLTTDPGFSSPSFGDFRLQGSSLAIDRGVDLTLEGVISDITGGARPYACCFDIGAYEFGR